MTAPESDDAEESDDADVQGLNDFHAYSCAFCFQENQVFVDASGARRQQFTEDCEVCCRPNLVTLEIGWDGSVHIEAEREYDA